MKKIQICLLFNILFFNYHAVGQIMFQKYYGTANQEFTAQSGQLTTDGGYVIVGKTDIGSHHDYYLVKTDSVGNLEWANSYGGDELDWPHAMKQTADGGFIITGSTNSFGVSDANVYLIKTDGSGNLTWSKIFSSSSGAVGWDVLELSNGDFLTVGGSGGEILLIRTNSSGNLVWSKTCGGTGLDNGFCIRQTSEGGFIISGFNQSGGGITRDIFIVKTDSDCNLEWSKRYGSSGQEEGVKIQETSDGGFIIGATTMGFGMGAMDLFILRTDSIGDLLWSETFGGSSMDWLTDLQPTTDGGYIITGHTNSFGAGSYDQLLIKLNAVGDSLWTKIYGTAGLEESHFVKQTTDGGFVFGGGAIPPGAGDMFLVKTDSMGNSGCNQNTAQFAITIPVPLVDTLTTTINLFSTSEISPSTVTGSGGVATTLCTSVGIEEQSWNNLELYPNPVYDVLFVNSGDVQLNGYEIYNIAGALLAKEENIKNTFSIDTRNLEQGIYFLKLISGTGVTVKRIEVLRN